MHTRLPLLLTGTLAAAAICFAVAFGSGHAGTVNDLFFILTALLEVAALVQATRARLTFAPGDPGRRTWALIAAFLGVRALAELRYVPIFLGLVPGYTEGASSFVYFYVVGLRYLFTLSDVLLIWGLVTAVRTYRGVGLEFHLESKDYVYIAAVCGMALTTALVSAVGIDPHLARYRMVGSTLAAVIGALTIVMGRYGQLLGGGALGRVWNAVVWACTARVASFFFATLVSRVAPGPVADFAEQCLLWGFACWWLLAALNQLDLLRHATQTREQYA